MKILTVFLIMIFSVSSIAEEKQSVLLGYLTNTSVGVSFNGLTYWTADVKLESNNLT